MTKPFKYLTFRPTPQPAVDTPLGARSVGHYRINSDTAEPVYIKPFVQIFWGIEGVGTFIINGVEHLLKPDHIAIYFPNSPHHLYAHDTLWEYRWWTMDGALTVNVVNAFGLTQSGIYRVGPAPVELFEQLDAALHDITPAGERHASALAFQLLARAANQQHTPTSHLEPHIQQAISMIHQRWNQSDFGVEILARQLDLHRSRFSRLFHGATGVTPSEYINNLRIQQALSQLKQTTLSIADIAENCGFRDPNYFARAIRRHTHLSPSEFRRQ